MEKIVAWLIIGLIFGILWLVKGPVIEYLTLFSWTYDYEYDYANFNTFLKVYKEYSETIHCNNDFLWNDHMLLQMSCITFDKHLMVLYPFSYLKYRTWLKEHLKKDQFKRKRKKGLFN